MKQIYKIYCHSIFVSDLVDFYQAMDSDNIPHSTDAESVSCISV